MSAFGGVHWGQSIPCDIGWRPVSSPTFQEGPVLCEVDFAHGPKAYPAEQVARDWSLEKERVCPVSRFAL